MEAVLVWQFRQIDIPNVRAVVCKTVFDVIQARQHNDMNVLCIGADKTSSELLRLCVKHSINTVFKRKAHKASKKII